MTITFAKRVSIDSIKAKSAGIFRFAINRSGVSLARLIYGAQLFQGLFGTKR
jgi:hypothetical protein